MIHHPHSFEKEDFPQLVMALGFFDGVHLGHQQVINKAKKIADQKGIQSAVMTFDPHPSVVLGRKQKHVHYITPLEEKKRIISEMGIDYLFIIRFTSDFAALEPQAFVDQYIINMNVQHVVAGFDYTYGKFGKGTMSTLPEHSRDAFSYTVVNKYEIDNEKVSSSRIRKLLNEGETVEVIPLLGRPFQISGTVIHGDKRGRTIGFPTANIGIDSDYLIPKTGVYAVKIQVNQQWYEGVCNLGYKPTFQKPDEPSLSIEVHILDFDHSIYGEEVQVQWFQRIRDERKFNGINGLITQIEIDKQTALCFFEKLLT
ncbi:bifunctional riboflavin kinase/FAD synthetase [Oikeobacillus pervagus]|nr:bifunctional riboflavin kinase/FAD synthetase [Oikeobacillus pervagus]